MTLTPIAHGSLGQWDELIFIGVIVVFITLMAVNFIESRNSEPELDKPQTDDAPPRDDRFQLD